MKKVRRHYCIDPLLDQALDFASADLRRDKSSIVSEALRTHLANISKHPVVLETLAKSEQSAA